MTGVDADFLVQGPGSVRLLKEFSRRRKVEAGALLRVRLVDQREHGIRVGMIDKLVRQERVQKRLHRRVRAGAVRHMDPQLVDHLLIGQLRERPQPAQRIQADRGMALRSDRVEVPAGSFHAEH